MDDKPKPTAKQIACRWKPGQSGNPNGKAPNVKTIPDILRKIGEEEIDTKEGTITKQEAVLRAVYIHAIKGKPWAVEFIADRTEGKAVQRTEITSRGGDPLTLRYYIELPEDDLIRELKVLREQQQVIAEIKDNGNDDESRGE